MKITRPITNNIVNPNAKRVTEDIYKLLNGNISFGTGINTGDKNLNGTMVEIVNTGPANTSVTVTHNLGRIPKFIDLKYKSIPGDWSDAGTAWTKTQVFIMFTAANMRVRLFIH